MSRLPAQQRRSQLLDHAGDLFSKVGYARATTAEVAKAAGVTEPIIYRHFASKRDLFVALIERSAERTIATWEKHLTDAKDPAERLLRLLSDNPMVSPSGRDDYKVLLQAITEVDDKDIGAAVKKHLDNLHAFIAKEIKLAQDAHRVTTRFSAEVIAWLLIHIGMGYGVVAAMGYGDHGADAQGVHPQDVVARILVGKAAEKG
ncbi:MAG TPA: TetR/AcrR family transcriptional regulator [Phycisphaerales bacterium]